MRLRVSPDDIEPSNNSAGAASQNAISLGFKQLARGLHVVFWDDRRCCRFACGDSLHRNKLMS
jgi:hypothetical protein